MLLRNCLVTGRQLPKDRLLRFVVGPEGDLVPDLDEKLPGRGLWLSGERDMVNTACAKGLFAKAARRSVDLPEDLADRVDDLMARRCLDLIGLARRAGEVVSGFEKTKARLREGRGGVLLQARDGAADGQDKIRALAKDLPVVNLFRAEELGRTLGRDNAVHGVIDRGRLARRLIRESERLMAFRGAKR